MSTNGQEPEESNQGPASEPGADESAEEPAADPGKAAGPEPPDDEEDWADTATVQMQAIPDPDAKD